MGLIPFSPHKKCRSTEKEKREMKSKMIPAFLFSAFVAMALLTPARVGAADVSLTSDGKVPGQPFQYLQNQVTDLQGRVAELERVDPQTFSLTCGSSTTITDAVKFLKPGDTLLVSGACSENVVISEEVHRITLNGQGSAIINGPDSTRSTIQVMGRGITIKNFASIAGGTAGILVTRGGAATINNNTIQNTGTNGITVNLSSSARIINNTIQNNPANGIFASESSSVRIGILLGADAVASPNIIRNNSSRGVVVQQLSSAQIVGNTIQGNASDGVRVVRGAQADISSNTINSNGGDGIFLNENAVVNSGEDTGTTIFDLPNVTTANNAGFGISCRNGGVVNGRQGTINGALGAINISTTNIAVHCHNSLIP
jgi:parallel beta-helix repeat protein